MIIKLVRHGQSYGNANGHNNAENADHAIELTEKGVEQALEAGRLIGGAFVHSALIYTSPYLRARQTCENVLKGATEVGGVRRHDSWRYEDPRLREVEHGYYDVAAQDQESLASVHGPFYYRYKGGESAADCYDRVSTFLESMMRQAARKKVDNILIVSHGITIRCFVMRFMHLSVEAFGTIRNPWNGDVITIGPKHETKAPQFTSGKWAVEGLKFRENQDSVQQPNG